MKETGIYGGSFNPIHKGHVQLAETICQEGWVDEVWFLVSPQNPFKQDATDLMDEQVRLSLAQIAVRNHPRLKACDFEFSLPRPSYTAHTLAALRKAYPERRFTLIIGADNWQTFPLWKSPEEILLHHRILIYPRSGYPIDEAALPAGVDSGGGQGADGKDRRVPPVGDGLQPSENIYEPSDGAAAGIPI